MSAVATLACACALFVSLLLGARLAEADVCPESNDLPSTACFLPTGVVVQGTIERQGGYDGYRIDVALPDTVLVLDLSDLPADYDLYVATGKGEILGHSAREGTAPESVRLTIQTPGTYYAYVANAPNRAFDANRPYTLRLTTILPPGATGPLANSAPSGGPPDGAQAAGSVDVAAPPPTPVPTATPVPSGPRVGRIYFSLDSNPDHREATDSVIFKGGGYSIYAYADFYGVTPPHTINVMWLRNGSAEKLSGQNQPVVPDEPDGIAEAEFVTSEDGKLTFVVLINGKEAARRDCLTGM
ncbi:MAG: hypothetical protein IT307_19665 [Chloroflexi bacterium]|nr:hypothetical protein [Chloroflexota bacterium]